MDLVQLKNIWEKSFQATNILDRDKIVSILTIKHRSNTALESLKRSFKMELITGGLMYIIMILALLILLNIFDAIVMTGLVSLFMLPSLIYYYSNYKKIKNTIFTESNIKQALIRTTNDIERFIKSGSSYKRKIFIIPLATLVGMLIGIYIVADGVYVLDIISSLNTKSLIMISFVLFFSFLLIPISIKMFKRRYVSHVNELKEFLKYLE